MPNAAAIAFSLSTPVSAPTPNGATSRPRADWSVGHRSRPEVRGRPCQIDGDSGSARTRHDGSIRRRRRHALPMALQPAPEIVAVQSVDTRRPAIAHDLAVRPLHVAAFNHLLHEPVALRFRSPVRRCTHLGTDARTPRIPSGCFAPGPPRGGFCLIDGRQDRMSYSRSCSFGPSVRAGTYYGIG